MICFIPACFNESIALLIKGIPKTLTRGFEKLLSFFGFNLNPLPAAIIKAKDVAPAGVWIQVEVENLAQLEQAIAAGATMILLDNMDLDQTRQAVKLGAGRAKLEASGGITLETVRAVAETGVDRISIGSLTKDIKAVDLSMRFD